MNECSRPRFSLSIILIAVAAVLLASSCGRATPDAYYTKLKTIDILLAEGKVREAGRQLLALRRHARGASQWLGITKRERRAGLYSQAAETLERALKKIPANDSLAAVLVDTLLVLDKPDEALKYASSLVESPFFALAAEAGIRVAISHDKLEDINPGILVKAYEGTQEAVFLRDAIVLMAVQGDLSSACSLVLSVKPQLVHYGSGGIDRYMSALVCYDAGLLEQASSLLEADGPPLSFAEILLAADASWRMHDTERARRWWNVAIERQGAASALPYYNLSLIAPDAESSSMLLEACLEKFPGYYPAVVSFVRRVPVPGKGSSVDSITEALGQAGFRSLDMERRERRDIFEYDRAVKLLANSIIAGNDTPDVRLLIESMRFNNRNNPDAVRSRADMWKLLERIPSDETLREYAVWFFTEYGEYSTAFSINTSLPSGGMPFYRGLAAAMDGHLDESLEYFSSGAGDGSEAWASLANIAVIHLRQKDPSRAIEEFSLAANMSPDQETASRLHLEIARILADMRLEERALNVLAYALELDPGNYEARALLLSLESGR